MVCCFHPPEWKHLRVIRRSCLRPLFPVRCPLQVSEGYAFMSAEIRERGVLEEVRGKAEEVADRRRRRAVALALAQQQQQQGFGDQNPGAIGGSPPGTLAAGGRRR